MSSQPSPASASSPNTINPQEDVSFDSQLYLFEAVGTLISSESLTIQKQCEYLQMVATPLYHHIT
jgi:exportin-T